MNETPTHGHVRDLDALRGIAISGVLITHVVSSLSLMGMTPPGVSLDLTQLLVTGGLGVQLFFLLSGFLLTTTEQRRQAIGTYSVRGYARRRFLRLAPAYYVSLPIYLLVAVAMGQYRPQINPTLDLLTYVSFLHGVVYGTGTMINPSYWSLTVEVVFYAALPVILCYVPTARGRLALYVALLAIAGGTYYVYAQDPRSSLGWYLIFHPLAHLHLFIAGMLLADLSAHAGRGDRVRLPAGTGDAALLVALFGIILNAYLRYPTAPLVVVSRLGGETLVALGFAGYVIGSPILRAILALPGLAYLGRVSYSIFLLHNLVMLALEQAGLVTFLRGRAAAGAPHLALFAAYLALTLVLSLVLASLSYRWIEVPGIRGFRRTRPVLAPVAV